MKGVLSTMRSNTRVINIKSKEPYDVYIGRPSPAGNPFRIGPGITRKEAIARYRPWFYYQLEHTPGFKEYILSLAGKTMGCYCKPLPCHGDIIVEYLDGK